MSVRNLIIYVKKRLLNVKWQYLVGWDFEIFYHIMLIVRLGIIVA